MPSKATPEDLVQLAEEGGAPTGPDDWRLLSWWQLLAARSLLRRRAEAQKSPEMKRQYSAAALVGRAERCRDHVELVTAELRQRAAWWVALLTLVLTGIAAYYAWIAAGGH